MALFTATGFCSHLAVALSQRKRRQHNFDQIRDKNALSDSLISSAEGLSGTDKEGIW